MFIVEGVKMLEELLARFFTTRYLDANLTASFRNNEIAKLA